MTLKELLETEGLKNVQVHPFFNNLENASQASIDDLFKKEELALLRYNNNLLEVAVFLTYNEGSYSFSGHIDLKDQGEEILSREFDPFTEGKNYDLIKEYARSQLSEKALKSETKEDGIDVANEGKMINLGRLHIYKSYNSINPDNLEIKNSIAQSIQGFSIAALGLSVMYDAINNVRKGYVGSNISEHIYQYVKDHCNNFNFITTQPSDFESISQNLEEIYRSGKEIFGKPEKIQDIKIH